MGRAVRLLPVLLLFACEKFDGKNVRPPLREEVVTYTSRIVLSLDDPNSPTENRTCSLSMVEIPGGHYRVGSPSDETGRDPGEPTPHGVDLKTFWIGKFEVTWDQYEAFYMNVNSDADAESWPSIPLHPPDEGRGRGRHPAQRVRRFSAELFCRWLSEKTGWRFRLPTEDEWEVACRAGSWEARPEPIDEHAWHAGNSGTGRDGKPRNQEVGKKKANGWGIHDMLGGIAEAVHGDEGSTPVYRGGSYLDPVGELRAANRQVETRRWNARDIQRPQGTTWYADAPFAGFRLAADGPPPSK